MKVKLLQDIEGNNIYPLSSMNTVIDDQGNPLQLELYQYRDEIKKLSKIPLTKAGDGTLYLANDGKYKELPPVNVNELVHITLSSNQDLKDILGATITINLEGGSQETYIWNGNVITLDLIYGTDYTINVSNINGYTTPESKTFTAIAANTRRVEMVYTASVISFDSNVLAQVLVNDLLINTNETIKVPFGSIVNMVPQDLEGYTAPQSITIIADAINKEVVLSYIQSVLEINILSNQTNDETILNASVNISYNDTTVEVKNGFTAIIPVNSEVTILFPEIEGYKKPEDIVFTYTGGYVKKTGIYYTELLTVNVSADQGNVSGFEVTISKQATVGVATKYTRLEYIESKTRSAYIDTGFIPNSNTRVVMDAEVPDSSSAVFVMGVNDWTSGKYFQIRCSTSGTVYISDYGSQSGKSTGVTAAGRLLFDKNKNVCTIGDVVVTNTASSFTCNSNLKLLAGATTSGGHSAAIGKIYSCQVYDNDTLIRDYIPAMRSDGIVGLYDAINDTFTASSSDTNFVAGNIAEEIIATQTSITGTYKIPFDESYIVNAKDINGYTTPSTITRVANSKNYTATMQYTVITVRDLSMYDVYGNPIAQSTANCYVIREAGQYKFPLVYGNAIKNGQVNTAAFTNNGGANSHDFVEGEGRQIDSPYLTTHYIIEYVHILNQDEQNVISNCVVTNEDGLDFVQFNVDTIPATGANIIIAAAEDRYIWHWHIWVWPHDLSPVEITNATGVKYNIMPVNLASKYDSDGVHIKNWFYQWGRMTPMLLPSAWNSTTDHTPGEIIKYSKADSLGAAITEPTMFYYNSSSPYNWFGDKSYYNLWDAACTGTGASDNDTVKTVYDPCPVGWKVPNGNVFTGFSTSNVVGSFDGGWKFKRYSGDTVGVFFPVSGCRGNSEGLLYGVGSGGYVWLSSAHSQNLAYSMHFTFDSVHQQNVKYRAYGYSVRPVQDEDLELAPHELLIEVPNVNGFTVTITNDSGEILATQTDPIQLHSIPWGTTYTITCSDVAGYITPEPQTYVASVSRRELQLNYIKQPSVSVNIKSNQLNDDLTVKAMLYRGSEVVGNIGNGDSYVFSGTEYNWKLVFPEIEGYKTPDPIEFEWYGLEDVLFEAVYQCELLTVNVSAYNGSISEFEITITKAELVGIAEKYIRLEYIESDGTQYIDTGVVAKSGIKAITDMELLKYGEVMALGCYGPNRCYLIRFDGNNNYIGYGYVDLYNSTRTLNIGERYVIETNLAQGSQYMKINGETIITSSNTNSFNNSRNIFAFAYNNMDTALEHASLKMYSMKIYDNNTLVRDYIPALRFDGTAGLYDAVSDTFTVSSGSSHFIASSLVDKIIATQTSNIGSYKIPFGIEYIVYASYKDGYTTPMPQSFTANQTARIYNIQYTLRPGTLNPSYGVYIQDTEGYCYTESEWDGSKVPNGVAVVTENCRFVMALNYIFDLWSRVKFSSLNTSVDGITRADSFQKAKQVFDGEKETDLIIKGLKEHATAANAAKNFTFPNGKLGYLGSVGEWYNAHLNSAKIESALALCGGEPWNTFSWTSTMNYSRAWLVSYPTGTTALGTCFSVPSTEETNNVRAFTQL